MAARILVGPKGVLILWRHRGAVPAGARCCWRASGRRRVGAGDERRGPRARGGGFLPKRLGARTVANTASTYCFRRADTLYLPSKDVSRHLQRRRANPLGSPDRTAMTNTP